MPSMRIFITGTFEAVHSWPDAPQGPDVPLVARVLSRPHRHLFHYRVEWAVTHDDRDREFLTEKQKVQEYCALQFTQAAEDEGCLALSCEHMARELLHYFCAKRVEVSEDGENGAVYETDTPCFQCAEHNGSAVASGRDIYPNGLVGMRADDHDGPIDDLVNSEPMDLEDDE